jgi:hypothetical protein
VPQEQVRSLEGALALERESQSTNSEAAVER